MKKFAIIIKSIKDEPLKTPICYIREHELSNDLGMNEYEFSNYLYERYYEEALDLFDLYESDEVEIHTVQNK